MDRGEALRAQQLSGGQQLVELAHHVRAHDSFPACVAGLHHVQRNVEQDRDAGAPPLVRAGEEIRPDPRLQVGGVDDRGPGPGESGFQEQVLDLDGDRCRRLIRLALFPVGSAC